MHAVVMESLEDYLAGTLEPSEIRAIEAHLSNCDRCREQIRGMQSVSLLFGSLQSEAGLEASPAFFSGILEKTGTARSAPSFANFFDLAFGRRLVFASLLTLAVTGSYLVTRESQAPAATSPAAIMAQQDAPGFDSAPAPDNMLVTLTAYER
jgi:anti-sigma factor RsiW